MHGKIAVDAVLSNVREYLEQNGFEVVDPEKNLGHAKIVITSGLDKNYLGDESIKTEVPVIDASGLTEDQVLAEVERRLNISH
ncbi:MAG TPA: YkuS family protein [Natronincola sp.]|nr:YkuS family protein [Natronincola sp.]